MSATYSKKWGPNLYYPRDMNVVTETSFWAPEPDAIKHLDANGIPTCFLAWSHYLRNCKGWWFTSDLPVASLAKNDPYATEIKLTGFTYNKAVFWGGPFLTDVASLLVELDGARVIDRPLEGFDGAERTILLNQPLTGTKVKFGLYQYAGAGAGSWLEQHVWAFKVWGEYVTSTPPTPRSLVVRVYDVATSKSIRGATAMLLSGGTIVASSQTDANGLATLNAFNQTYLLKVYAVDYAPYPFEAAVDLTLGNSAIDAPLTYVAPPPFELPWWWWIPAGAVGFGVLYWLFIRAPPAEKPIYVVK